jgi:MATE family multidrug resistance protein
MSPPQTDQPKAHTAPAAPPDTPLPDAVVQADDSPVAAEEVACQLVPAGPRSLPAGPVAWQVLALSLPMLGEQVLSFLVGMVDTYLAGTISKEATVAVGTAAYLGWFVTLAFTMVGVGAAALVSRSFGANDTGTANRALNQAMWLAVLLGVAVAVGTFACAPLLAGFLTRTPEALALCTGYLRIVALGYVLASINMVGGAVLRAAGDTVAPMNVMAAVNVANVVVSFGLVFGWFGIRAGVAGIAIGTLAARSLGGLLMALLLIRGLRGLRVRTALLRPEAGTTWRILRVGLPAAADTTMMSLAQLAFIKIISHTGRGDAATANFAAHVIAMQMEAISYMPALAWGTAAATLVGQYLGARRPRLARRSGHVAALQAGALGALAGAAFFLLAELVYALMSNDPMVQDVGVPAFRLLAFAQPFLCMGIVYINALRGAGDTRTTTAISLVCGLLLRVPVAYLGGVVLAGGLIGAWCGMWADNVVRCLLALGRFVQGGWRRVRV